MGRKTEIESKVFGDMDAAFDDPGHPGFHLTAPSHFTIDFWGPAIKDGYYHIFYHVCPEKGDIQAETVFFHSRSNDLINWEMLPVPIIPAEDELRMNDGCICFDGKDKPIMMYTKVPKDQSVARTHCAAYGTDDLLEFTRIDNNPFMSLESHGGPDFQPGWSDPYVFKAEGRTFMLMSKCVTHDDKNLMPIYEATDGSMLNWEYKGIFFENNGEVVNFFNVGDKWVLIYSPYNTIEYFVGDFDLENLKFVPEYHDILCYGYHSQNDPVDRGFYASYVYEESHRKVISGWISGFSYNEYWNGCMGIPREVGLSDDLRITQKPITEFFKLRGDLVSTDKQEFIGADMMDIEFSYNGDITLSVGYKLTLEISDDGFSLCGEKYFCEMPKEKTVRLLIDKTVAEIFFGDGSITATSCFEYIGGKPPIKIDENIQNFKCFKVNPCNIKRAL